MLPDDPVSLGLTVPPAASDLQFIDTATGAGAQTRGVLVVGEEPLVLGAKEGLALINGTEVMNAVGALVCLLLWAVALVRRDRRSAVDLLVGLVPHTGTAPKDATPHPWALERR